MAMIEIGDTFLFKGFEWEVKKGNITREGIGHWWFAENCYNDTMLFLNDHMYHWIRNSKAVLLPRREDVKAHKAAAARSANQPWPDA